MQAEQVSEVVVDVRGGDIARDRHPAWFATLIAETRAELDTARQQLADEHTARRQHPQRIAAADNELAAAQPDAGRAFERVKTAREHVEHASAQVTDAERQLASARRWRRPTAQTRLDQARLDLATVTRQLADVEKAAAPAIQRWRTARQERDVIDSDEVRQHLDRVVDPPRQRIVNLQHRLDALDDWHTWATGGTCTSEQLRRITTLDRTNTRRPEPRFEHLAAITREWAATHHIELPTNTSRQRQLDGNELGL